MIQRLFLIPLTVLKYYKHLSSLVFDHAPLFYEDRLQQFRAIACAQNAYEAIDPPPCDLHGWTKIFQNPRVEYSRPPSGLLYCQYSMLQLIALSYLDVKIKIPSIGRD